MIVTISAKSYAVTGVYALAWSILDWIFGLKTSLGDFAVGMLLAAGVILIVREMLIQFVTNRREMLDGGSE